FPPYFLLICFLILYLSKVLTQVSSESFWYFPPIIMVLFSREFLTNISSVGIFLVWKTFKNLQNLIAGIMFFCMFNKALLSYRIIYILQSFLNFNWTGLHNFPPRFVYLFSNSLL